ncbi:MAG TPA: outer membrane beta-barrel protein [Steroidobacteraceae bacterium]|nr:outer membrane beta-barrel protein [Steroidobacteraceae bacterium]
MRKSIFLGRTLSTSAAAVALLLCLASPARAADPQRHTNDWEFTPFAGFTAGGEFEDPTDGSDRDLDEDSNFGLIINAAVDEWRHYELLYSTQSTTVEGATPIDMDVQYLQIGGIVSHPDTTRVIPYFGLTVGAARFSPDGPGLDDETKLAASVAGGFRVPITQHFAVRLDLRAFVTVLDTDGDLFCVSDGGATCAIRAKSDTFLQYSANLGVTVGF